jgi:ssDNA-specific exonuclease RecJ
MKKKKHSKRAKKKNQAAQSKYHNLNMIVSDRLKELRTDSNQISFIDNPDKIKMSAVILKLSEPYIKMYWGNEIQVRGIISLAITAWNMAFLPQKEQTEMQEKWIEEVLPNDCDAKDIANMISVFENFQQRQIDLFPDIRKFIMGYDLRIDNDDIHLDISSAPLDKKK